MTHGNSNIKYNKTSQFILEAAIVILVLSTKKKRTRYATDILTFEAYVFLCLLPKAIHFIISVVRSR